MNNLKILHLAGDSVFIDSAINAFERAAPGENDLYIYGRKPLKFTKSPALRVSLITLLTGAFLKKIRKYDLVVVHALTPNWYKSILLIPKNIVVIWLGWGFDYYDIIYNDQREMLLSLTKNLLNTKLKKQRNY